MVSITVLMLVATDQDGTGAGTKEDSAVDSIARLCTLPAKRLGCTHPRHIHALVSSLLTMAQDDLRKCPHGGTVHAHVRYLGQGAYSVSVKTQTQAPASSDAPQELFSGVVMNLDDAETVWTCRTDDTFEEFQAESAGLKDTGRNGRAGSWKPDMPSQEAG